MSKDTIYRDDAIDEMERIMADHPLQGYEDELLLIDAIKSLPSADRPSEITYGNEHNCMMTIFGECSYAETGCGDCAVVEKVRKALSADRPQGSAIALVNKEAMREDLSEEIRHYLFFDLRHKLWDLEVNGRPQGEWIFCEDEYGIDGFRCSHCGKHIPWDYQHKFINFIHDYHTCPFCDARMKGVDDVFESDR